MTVDYRKVSLPFLGGADTKSDEFALQPPKLAAVENAVFDKRGSIRTRPGSVRLSQRQEDGTTLVEAAQGLITRGDELCLLDGANLLSYAESIERWYDRGPACPLDITSTVAAAMPTNQLAPDYDEADGVGVYAWEDSRGGVRYSVVDTGTGELLYSDQSIASDGYAPRVIAIDGFVVILYVDNSSADLRAKVIKPRALSASVAASSVQVTTDIRSASAIAYDVQLYGSRAVLAWVDAAGTGMRMGHLSKAGVLTNTSTASTITATPTMTCLALGVPGATDEDTSLGKVAVGTAGGMRTITVSVVSPGPSTGATWSAATGAANPLRIALGQREPVVATVGAPMISTWAVFVEYIGANDWLNYVTIGRITTASVASTDYTIRHACLASGGFRAGDYACVVLSYVNTIQPTYFVYRHDAVMVGRFAASEAGGYPRGTRAAYILANPKGSGQSWQWVGAARKRLETEPTVDANGTVTGINVVRAAYEIRHVVLDFSVTPAAVEVGGCAYLTGGMLWQYDGQGVAESGFALAPESTSAAVSNGTGSLSINSTYAYRVYYEWTNAQGERERSGALPVIATTGATDDTVTLTIQTLSHTRKSSVASPARGDVSITVYRTQANPTYDAPFYRVSGTDPATTSGANRFILNTTASDTVTFQDDLSDTSLITRELDYQNSGEFENLAPGPADIIAQGQDRVFLAGLDDPNKVAFSKLHYAGEAVAFADGLEIVVEQEGGPITALGMLNEQLVVFKRSAIYVVQGTGPSNLGAGEYGTPQLVTSDVGCAAPASIVSVPDGLMFQSAKGIYLLDQGLRVSYVGADVEAYNAQTVTAATLIADRNQVRFLSSSGVTLLYDYLFQQWSTWTNYQGVAAVLWRGETYCRVQDTGRVYQEDASTYTDGGADIRLAVQTAWIKAPATMQGYMRVRRVSLLAHYRSPHVLRCYVGRNYEGNWDYSWTWDPADVLNVDEYGADAYGSGAYGGSGSTVYQPRHRLRDPKCEAIRFRFEVVPGSPAGEALQLTELALELGELRGLHRRPAAKTANSGG